MQDEKKLLYLKRRLQDLAVQAETQRIYTHTAFLTPLEQGIFLSCKQELPQIPAFLSGGMDAAIRKLAVFGSPEEFGYAWESPIRTLHLHPKAEKFAEDLTHRDYLGALMGLGIERELTGDILIRQKEAWVLVLESIVPFLTEHLTQVRRTAMICEETTGAVPQLAPAFEVLKFHMASERLDLLLSSLCKCKREDAKKLLKANQVFLNGLPVTSAGQKVKQGDEIVIRGFGKYLYDGIDAVSKKGRLHLTVRKYC